MKQTLLILFLLFSLLIHGQCFDCAKNFGGWNDDYVADLKKTNDAIYLIKNSGNFGISAAVYKFDLNCNLIWKKEIDNFEIYASKLATDSNGNVYLLITWTNAHNAVGPFPAMFSGVPMHPGLNLYKFDKNGNLIWNKSLGRDSDFGMRNIFINNDIVYITGTFHNSINIDNQITLTNPITNGYLAGPTVLFILKFSPNGNLLDAKQFGTGDEYLSAEIDKDANLYFSRYSNSYIYAHSDIDKIDKNLNLVWTKEISNNKITKGSVLKPTLLRYNSNNNKLYLWSAFYKTVDVLGTIYTDPTNPNYITQSLLSEFSTATGDLERIKQFNNSSTRDIPGMDGSSAGNTAFLAEKDNDLYIFSSFTRTLNFTNTSITSSQSGSYNKEELVLFKVNLQNFNSEFILKSFGTTYYSNNMSTDAAGPILFNGNDLYLTADFESSPLTINNTIINNNSGNNTSDVMLYKYKLDPSINSGEILAENTCFNTPTNLSVNGTFDSILWDFNDPNSTVDNTSSVNNPQHQFSAKGTYNVSAIVKCGSETQTINKEIVINDIPISTSLNSIYACETISGSGISNSFDTSDIHSIIVANQNDLVVEYRTSDGILLSSPLPNPYTNKTKNEEIIKIKSYFRNNPLCYVETDLKLFTINKPINPTADSPQTFCIKQNATLEDIIVNGQNKKWYDAAIAGTILPNTTVVQNDVTYFVSQTINGCESARIPISAKIQNTLAPTGDVNQPFCTGQNPTITNIQITGNLIKWYDSDTNGNLLATTTNLEDGKTYYASQIINSCESTRLAITVSVGDTPIAPLRLDSSSYCKNENATLNNIQVSGQNLKWYSSNMAASILPNNTLLVNNTTYYVSQTTGCESERTAILVQVYDTPLPTGSRTQQFCIDEIATLENINLTGTAIKWYDAPANGNLLPETTLLQSNTYYASQTLNNCESERLALTIKIQDTQIPIADSPQSFCIQKNVTINDIDITGQNIKWFESASSTIALSESTPLENGNTYYATQTLNNCESDRIPVTINILEATHKDCINLVDELPFPKFFTPNDDGYNDAWSINFDYLAPNSSIRIYDRYGKLLKQLSKNTSWNGTYSGQDLPASDYWFTVTRANGTEFRGHFSLKR